MKKTQLITMLFMVVAYLGKAQVNDISFTLSPAAEYTWWDDKAGLEDNLLIGGKLGFGFGEFIELRGVYLQSLDQKTDFSNYRITGFDASLFDAQDVTITRYGGEFKANFGTKGIKPYFTLGAGVQNIDLDNAASYDQVYGALGLGVKFNIANRLVFALEGKNTTYRFNSGTNLLSDNDKTDFGVTDADFDNERLSNWSVQGSLQFYLGGRKPGELSELDKAYLQKFKGGFKGLQWVIEPSMAYVDFDNQSLFRDTYWLGGYVGLDLNEYIGVRAFYFQATQNEEISTDFDKIAMYGGEFRARLNDGNGVTPFLILGGGYLNPSNNYVPAANQDGTFSSVNGGEFATGGLGLNIPLGKHILITGGARAMVTSGSNVTDITSTDDIQTHIFYNAGLKFTLGKKSKSPQTVYQENVNQVLSEQQAKNEDKLAALKADYANKIAKLEQELKQAYENNDVEKAVEILEEKKVAEKALQDVKNVEKVHGKQVEEQVGKQQKTQNNMTTKKETVVIDSVAPFKPLEKTNKSELIQMTPAEFESLIDRILKDLDNDNALPQNSQDKEVPMDNNLMLLNQRIEQLNDRIELLEKLLIELNNKQETGFNFKDADSTNNGARVIEMNKTILERLDELNRKIDANSNKIQSFGNRPQTVIVTPAQNNTKEAVVSEVYDNDQVERTTLKDDFKFTEMAVVNDTVAKEPMLKYNNASALVGFNYGGASTGNIGLRLHYNINKTKLEFMPEAYVGFGEANSWVLSGNVIYPIAIKSEKFMPYAGAGLGFGNFVDGVTGFYNIVIGSKIPVLHKNLYVDYTMRNSFDYNHIALGYYFKF